MPVTVTVSVFDWAPPIVMVTWPAVAGWASILETPVSMKRSTSSVVPSFQSAWDSISPLGGISSR